MDKQAIASKLQGDSHLSASTAPRKLHVSPTRPFPPVPELCVKRLNELAAHGAVSLADDLSCAPTGEPRARRMQRLLSIDGWSLRG